MKRSLPPLHLTRSPLVMVIGQAKISTVASMERYIPEIQERLRRSGFPKFFADQVEEVTFSFGPARQQQEVQVRKRWAFQNKNSTWEIQVDTETITVATSEYERYDTTFEQHLKLALTSVNDVVGLGLVTRLGLRYVDLIRADEGESIDKYLQPGFLGLDPKKIGVTSMLSRFQSIARSDVGQLGIRCMLMNDGAVLPPDLRPSRLAFGQTVKTGETVCFLDLDHATNAERDFDLEGVLRTMADDLHDTLDVTFRAATTPFAMKKWGAKEVK